MRRTLLTAAILMSPLTCLAETYLCIGEAGAAVEDGGAAGIHAGLYDVSDSRYVISDASGSWQFKELGKDRSFLECVNETFCEVKGGFSTFFMKDTSSNVFTYVSLIAIAPDFKRKILYTVKGKCSEL